MKPNNQNKQISIKGQSLLEFAIAVPIFLVVVLGVFDVGRVFFSTITLVSAAREGARYLSANPFDLSNDSGSFFTTKQVVMLEATGAGITLAEENITVSCDNVDEDVDACDGGGPAVVTVEHDFELIMGWGLPSPITVSRTAEMIVP
jgi:Flp pilus assembly protein TadG